MLHYLSSCKVVAIPQGASASCPGGYSHILYMDMLEGPIYDDVRICTREVNAGEGSECLGGYVVYGKDNNVVNTGRVTVPKKLHARARVSNVYGERFGNLIAITIINETTGERVKDNDAFRSGDSFPLPYSEIQDQTFTLHPVPRAENHGRRKFYSVGVITFYVDHVYREKVANDPVWQELPCHDI